MAASVKANLRNGWIWSGRRTYSGEIGPRCGPGRGAGVGLTVCWTLCRRQCYDDGIFDSFFGLRRYRYQMRSIYLAFYPEANFRNCLPRRLYCVPRLAQWALPRTASSRRSAALAALSPGFVIPVANWRALSTYSGASIWRRSAISDLRVVFEKRRAVPTLS